MNHKHIATMLATIMVLSIVALVPGALAAPGNGAPSGGHDWNLNIIGVQNPKNFNIDEVDGKLVAHDNGRRLFVKLNKDGTKITTRINLKMGDSFQVIDPDGTDGQATLQLVDPYGAAWDPTIDDPSDNAAYRILIRALGKPGGNAVITTGFTNESGVDWLSLENVNIERKKGKSVFEDRTLELTTIYVDYDLDGTPEYYPIFGNELWDYFWDYDNYGLKNLQMRFYLTE